MKSVPLLDLMKDNAGCDRTFQRYQVNFPLSVQATAEESACPDFVPGLACNIGLSGISFVCSGRFDLGSLVEIEFALEAQAYSLCARIRWCQELNLPDDALRYYGAQFLRTDAALQFIPIMAKFLLAQSSDSIAGSERGRTPVDRPVTWA